jgi:hypothetical protein
LVVGQVRYLLAACRFQPDSQMILVNIDARDRILHRFTASNLHAAGGWLLLLSEKVLVEGLDDHVLYFGSRKRETDPTDADLDSPWR